MRIHAHYHLNCSVIERLITMAESDTKLVTLQCEMYVDKLSNQEKSVHYKLYRLDTLYP